MEPFWMTINPKNKKNLEENDKVKLQNPKKSSCLDSKTDKKKAKTGKNHEKTDSLSRRSYSLTNDSKFCMQEEKDRIIKQIF